MFSLLELLALLVILPFFLSFGADEESHFCYEDKECDEFSGAWGEECKGTDKSRQSPIDLQGSGSPWIFEDLMFNNGYASESFSIFNTGHTIEVRLRSTSKAEMAGYEMNSPYILEQSHFHWGGSEHTVRGRRFSLELHLVHYSSQYPDFATAAAAQDPKAIAVVGVFLQQSSPDTFCGNDLICSRGHKAILPIIKNLPLGYKSTKDVQEKLDLSVFLPRSGDSVYRYLGSLTTPKCGEKVLWTVVEQPIAVSWNDVQEFQKVQGENGAMRRNFRSIQKSNNRKVEYFRVR